MMSMVERGCHGFYDPNQRSTYLTAPVHHGIMRRDAT